MRGSIVMNLVISRRGKLFILGLLLLIPAFILSCSSGGDDSPPPETKNPKADRTVTFSGTASGSGGLVDVTVSAQGKSTTTDNNGFYTLNDVTVPDSDRIVLTYEKDGYATYQRSVIVGDSSTYTVAANLIQHHFSEMIDPTTAQPVVQRRRRHLQFVGQVGKKPLAGLEFKIFR